MLEKVLRRLRLDLGRRGERVAARHLKWRGYRILKRNLRTRHGEIDLLAEADDEHTIVFVEVKAGTGHPDAPEHHVDYRKQRKLTALAATIARKYELTDRPMRFDVIAIEFPSQGKPDIRHHIAAFESHV